MESKICLITGSSRGIGKAIAEAALAAGDRVICTARNPEDCEDLMLAYPQTCRTMALDVARPEQISEVAEVAPALWGRVDVLVNNAGYGLQGMVEEVTMEQVRRQMEVNFFGLVDLTQRFLAGMREQGAGLIVNVSSVAGRVAFPGLAFYHASKFAVIGFTEALAREVEPHGIQVISVEPGPYRTNWAGDSLDLSAAMIELDPEGPYYEKNKAIREMYEKRHGNQPGDPRQIAQVLLAASRHPQPPQHMLFGEVAIELWEQKLEQLKDKNHLDLFPHERTTL